MSKSTDDTVVTMIRKMGLVRPGDLEAKGVSRRHLYRLLNAGLIERQSRGVYVARRHKFTANHSLAQVAKRVSGGVFCLSTALRFHDMTTQSPGEVWIAISSKARQPRLDYPR